MRKKINVDVLNKVKETVGKSPIVKEIKFDNDETHIEVWLKKTDDTVLAYGGETGRNIRDEISNAIKSMKLEIGGVGELSNFENHMKAEKKYVEDNPKPIDPSSTRDWKKRSYYDRTKGKGHREYETYKKEMQDWRDAFMKADLPPRNFPGFRFDIESLGFADSVYAFYKGTKYFGD